MRDQSDISLWHRVKNDDTDAFRMLYEQYIDDLLRFGCSLTDNRDLVQDAIQNLYTNIWDKRSSINPPTHSKAYLLSALRNNLLRDAEREHKIKYLDSDQHLLSSSTIFIKKVDEEQVDRLQKAIQSLSIREREVIHLRYYQEIKNPEISDIMGISYQSVANLLQRALKQIKATLQRENIK